MAGVSSSGESQTTAVATVDINQSSASGRDGSTIPEGITSDSRNNIINWKSPGGCAACEPQISRTAEDSIIVIDGVANAKDRDAPGQNCVYILSGAHEREDYRTATFGKFPDNVPVFNVALAKAGFYFTGFRDRVKCFSCGMTVENWTVGDDAFQSRWHKTDCLMPRGVDPRNVPAISEYRVLCKGKYSAQQQHLAADRQAHTSHTTQLPGQQDSQYSDVTSRLQNVNIASNSPVSVRQIRFGDINDPLHENLLRNLNLEREEERRKTYGKWPSYPAPRLPRELAKNGLFYLGNLDRTQCFCCGGVLRNWMPGDTVAEQHQRHFPQCRLFTQSDSAGNIPMSEQARVEADAVDDARLREFILGDNDPLVEPPDPSLEEKRRLAVLFRLNNTVNPHMASLQQRIQSFAGWPSRTRATVEQIAKAGFFYLGQSDKTKCFHCNGGLQNWDRNDEPWTEHAKWFPGCAYVIREKGIDFVKRLDQLHPNLNRPSIRYPVSYNVAQDIPPMVEMPQTASTINIEAVTNMGFSADRVQRTMRRKMERDGRGYVNVQELIDDLLQEGEENERETNTSSTHEAGRHQSPNDLQAAQTSAAVGQKREGSGGIRNLDEIKKTRTESPSQNMESGSTSHEMEESIRVMQESDRCKKCRMNAADVMCIPCGHLALCSECSKSSKRCIICNAKVQSHMKVYRA